MCCLFGIIDYGQSFSGRPLSKMLSALSAECEARGTDATGIAYADHGHICIYKRPLPAHKMKFYLPDRAHVIMGHTRMTTQGSEKKSCNNHPFKGMVGGIPFALAHNGVLHNDKTLRRTLKLPKTSIETDSYIGVQLIEQKNALSFDSLKYMAEQVEGSFTFTVLDGLGNLYLVKGDNPMCLYHYPRLGLYLYASTQEILEKALKRIYLYGEKPTRVDICCGDILCIDLQGQITTRSFDTTNLLMAYRYSMFAPYCVPRRTRAHCSSIEVEYIEELKSVAGAFGYSPEDIDHLLDRGFTTDELEELLYSGEL